MQDEFCHCSYGKDKLNMMRCVDWMDMTVLVEHNGSVYRVIDESLKELGIWMSMSDDDVWNVKFKDEIVCLNNVRNNWEMINVPEIRMLIDDGYKNMYVVHGNYVKFLFGTEVYAIDRNKNEYAMLFRKGQVLVRMRKVN